MPSIASVEHTLSLAREAAAHAAKVATRALDEEAERAAGLSGAKAKLEGSTLATEASETRSGESFATSQRRGRPTPRRRASARPKRQNGRKTERRAPQVLEEEDGGGVSRQKRLRPLERPEVPPDRRLGLPRGPGVSLKPAEEDRRRRRFCQARGHRVRSARLVKGDSLSAPRRGQPGGALRELRDPTGRERHGAFKVQLPCAQRGAGVCS